MLWANQTLCTITALCSDFFLVSQLLVQIINADWLSHYRKHYGNTSKNLKWNCRLIHQSHFWEYIWRNPNTNSKEHKQHYVHCNVIYNCQDMEAAQVSIIRWVDKTTIGYLHNGILLGHIKEENFTICKSLDVPREHYAKWNKPVRERQIPYDFTHMWNRMTKLN